MGTWLSSSWVVIAALSLGATMCAAGGAAASAQPARKETTARLWYRQPASQWVEALPIGNGRLAAMVFGGVAEERLALNEGTLWTGVPHDYCIDGASSYLPEVRRLLFEGKEQEATRLADQHMMGDPVRQQAYQPLGDLMLRFPGHQSPTDYVRELDLSTGIARVSYRVGDAIFTRECFVSAPDQALIVTVRSNKPRSVTMEVALSTPHPHTLAVEGGGRMMLRGQWVGDGKEHNLQAGVSGGGIRFETGVQVRAQGGTVSSGTGCIRVDGASSVTVILCAATSYRSYHDISGDPSAICEQRLAAIIPRSDGQLRRAHVADTRRLMDRVHLDLGGAEADARPTDERLKAVAGGGDDPALCATYFQYGRYLLASSSRPGGQPANLQGIWNQDVSPAWGSKWTTNINTEMNYWPVEVCDLPECHEPLFSMLDDLTVTGGKTAKAFYNCRGWVLHHNTDIWRGAAPVDGVWGVWPMGSAWLARDPWEHYLFTGDREFLRKRAWPIMKGAARFVLDFLVEAPAGSPVAGKLVTCPSHSPENSFRKPDGSVSMFTYASTMDIAIVHDLLTSCLQAIDAMGSDAARDESSFRAEITTALARLAPLQISKRDGRLQEWVYDYDEPEPGHRHMSHFFGLHPGSWITMRGTPDLASAVRKSLEYRLSHGGGGTGWSRAWVVNFFARLDDGEQAYANLKLLLQRSTLPNLFDNHPPFQIDGNFGGCAGIAEMLLQSQSDEIELLPALPHAWPSGLVRGLVARGAYKVDIDWSDGVLTQATFLARRGGVAHIRYGTGTCEVKLAAGKRVRLTPSSFGAAPKH